MVNKVIPKSVREKAMEVFNKHGLGHFCDHLADPADFFVRGFYAARLEMQEELETKELEEFTKRTPNAKSS